MNASLWAEIVAAHDDCTRIIDAEFSAAGGKAPDLDTLRGRLHRRLDTLCARVGKDRAIEPEESLQSLAPLLYLVDEKVELRLAGVAGEDFPEWLQLQSILLNGQMNGGDAFYDGISELAKPPSDDSRFVACLYLFCLQAGFQGRLFDDPDGIRKKKEELADYLGPATHAAGAPATPAFHRAQPAWRSLLIALGGVIALQIVLLAITRAM